MSKLDNIMQEMKAASSRGRYEEVHQCMLAAIEEVRYNPIREARRLLWDWFTRDPQWKDTYVATIACTIMDFDKQRHIEPAKAVGPLTHTERQILAERIFERIFKEE